MRRKIGPGLWEDLGPGSAVTSRRPQEVMVGARVVGHMEGQADRSLFNNTRAVTGHRGTQLGIAPRRG